MRGRGFTIIEIMISLFVMMVGIVALYSLQVVAISGNVVAQEFTQATQLAERWIETLRKDSVSWTTPANQPARIQASDDWRDAIGPFMVNRDMLDEDSYAAHIAIDSRYCIKYRVQSVPAGDPSARMMRADVRVIWPRRDAALDSFQECNDILMQGSPWLRKTWQVSMTSTLYRHSGS